MRLLQIILGTLTLALGILMYTPAITQAAAFTDVCKTGVNSGNSAVCQQQSDTSNNISGTNGIIIKVANLIAIITGITAVFIIIVAGIRFITSSGDPSGVTSARNSILFAVIGLIVIIVARSIVVFIIDRFA